jgi:cytochrome c-type biogenesis protein CcmF
MAWSSGFAIKTDRRLFAHASVVIAGVQVFFLLLLNFAAHPFAVDAGRARRNGNGLNPLLQYPGDGDPPAHAVSRATSASRFPSRLRWGRSMMRYPGEKWIHITRRWTMVTWMFLTCGIFLGAHWAYSGLRLGRLLGLGPGRERFSLMPWLTGTAFLHSVMMQEKRGMMKSWNVWLIFATFMLTLLGTLLTRAGWSVRSMPSHNPATSAGGSWCILVIVLRRLPVLLLQAARPPRQREQARVDRQPRIELPVQQHDPAGRLLHRAVGDAFPGG